MSGFKTVVLLTVLSSLVATCLSQVSQEGPHVSQKGPYVLQERPHESQGGPHESQSGPHTSQEGPHESQEGPQESQEGPHQTQSRVRRQASQAVGDWVPCTFTPWQKISCHDCNTRIICKRIGGILKPCSSKQPFCNGGVCSTETSEKCA